MHVKKANPQPHLNHDQRIGNTLTTKERRVLVKVSLIHPPKVEPTLELSSEIYIQDHATGMTLHDVYPGRTAYSPGLCVHRV
jgi:hypothetical protein